MCNGLGCVGEMPGMGGPNESRNFILNCRSWTEIGRGPQNIQRMPDIRLAPVTGAVENIGFDNERDFYFDITAACSANGISLSLGDGTPDCKLRYGIQAVESLQKAKPETKAAVFIKPYPDFRILERSAWASGVAELFGIDIDSYNIVTMRNLVHLEKKTAEQLRDLKSYFNHWGFPFAIKGVFTPEDVALVSEVKPDVCFISNHGGRVDTVAGSTAAFLKEHSAQLKANCGSLWVDGGIRSKQDALTAASYGADTVLLGRTFITALCQNGADGVRDLAEEFLGS